MKVIFTSNVLVYFEELVFTLYNKEYFGFLEASQRYVAELIDEITTTLPLRSHRPAPNYFDRYGKSMKYAIFIKNRHTTWYVFFKTYSKNGEKIYLVRYIGNNHTIAHYL